MTTEQIDTISPELVDTLMTASPEQVEDLHRRLSEKLAAQEEERKAQEKFQKEEEKKIERWNREDARRNTSKDQPRTSRDPEEMMEVLEYFASRLRGDLIDSLYYIYSGESAEYRRGMAHSILAPLHEITFAILAKKENS
ncbi:MAG: hypothetical protein HN831_05365 [Waddliaceae bacterium]|jgi:hypothetical protein|nr:hypothetical protein [Candidatus Bathyarchaeota archaeon]MBT7264884.1 hypothetical protein [Waddliaceae bacterium]MBT7914647.1 hypothetical protein [Candidatus Bathyarchaeota archaeon]